jgi:hypothetical protein
MLMFRTVLFLPGILSLALINAFAQAVPQEPLASPESNALQLPNNSRWSTEDWNKLPLSESGLNQSRYVAVVEGHTEMGTYTREQIRVQWRLADPIDLYVVLPHGVKNPPAILYLYDYRFGTDRFRDEGWCTRVTRGGVAAIGLASALSIERRNNRPMKEWFVSELPEALGTSTHDVQMVLNYLASRGDIDMHRIGMLGQGSGGAIAALATAVDKRITAADLLDPWGDWPNWLEHSKQIPEDERSRYLTPKFLQSVSGMDPVQALRSLSGARIRVQQVMDDQITPREAKDTIAAAVHSPEVLRQFKDSEEHAAEWQRSGLTAWLREQLTESQPGKAASVP